MNSWADESEDHPDYTHGGSSGGVISNLGVPHTTPTGERPRLHLKPRSSTATATPASPSSTKPNPFGAAKPREEVLASKGIDPTLVDTRIEKKAHAPRLTAEQDRQVELLRKELTEIEAKMREANENELPEEEYRVAAEGKREELNELMRMFQEVNLEAGGGAAAAAAGVAGGGPSAAGREKEGDRGGDGDERRGSTTKFERPSERRRRLEQKRREERGAGGGGGGGYQGNLDRYHDSKNNYEGGDDPYASFGGSSRNRHHDSASGRGYGGSGDGDRDSYRGGGSGGSGRGRGGGARYHDRDNRGSYNGSRNDRYSDDHRNSGRGRGVSGSGGGGGGYNNPQRSNNRPTYDDKYAGDRYNY
mmetsp:Transcript_8767/g.18227  ORF Transcript_8767/g.18227 Transcript_8767/m.18227 type:complete len:361 (+) Transcript_8767:59-1141(+)